ncbi:MAG: hypothetical protein M1548_06455 [Actinobacteria bacterium]|nr:hypothetical protein [Actinomycetota bacterium]
MKLALDYAGLAQRAYALAVSASSPDTRNKALDLAKEAEFRSLNRLGIGLHSLQDLYAHGGKGWEWPFSKHFPGLWPVKPDDDTKPQNQEPLRETIMATYDWIEAYVYLTWQ